MKTRGATAAAVTELGQRSDGARRKKESVRREVLGWPIYKAGS